MDEEKNVEPDAELTRREWLLRLGETVALLGFSGAACASDQTGATPAAVSENGPLELPPGLYEPSNDHLTHALATDAPFHPIPPGSETDYTRPRTGPFVPQFFSTEEHRVLTRIVELMLGESPGAPVAREIAEWLDLKVFSSAGVRRAARSLAPEHRIIAVAYFGTAAVEELEKSDPQQIYREGLRWVAANSRSGYQKDFIGLSGSDQLEVLRRMSGVLQPESGEDAGTRLFGLMKSGVLRGFYTSSAGLKELDYKGNSFYAEPPGCSGDDHSG